MGWKFGNLFWVGEVYQIYGIKDVTIEHPQWFFLVKKQLFRDDIDNYELGIFMSDTDWSLILNILFPLVCTDYTHMCGYVNVDILIQIYRMSIDYYKWLL